MNSVDRKRGRGNCHVKNNVFSFCNMNETNNYRDHEKEIKDADEQKEDISYSLMYTNLF